jgi:hypothetical protein
MSGAMFDFNGADNTQHSEQRLTVVVARSGGVSFTSWPSAISSRPQ